MKATTRRGKARGFTLVELAVVIVTVGVIAAFVVPKFLDSMERNKAAAAFHYLSEVKNAQHKYQIRQGIYADDVSKLKLDFAPPEDFIVGKPAPTGGQTLESSWSLTLTRAGSAVGYGGYKVVFTKDGFDTAKSDIPPRITPSTNQ